jgi:RND family efflux transporter MFP subunit
MKKLFLSILYCTALLTSCKNKQDEHGHAHDSGPSPLSYTIYSDKTELFVEFKPLIVGQKSRFAAHLTKLGENFLPVTEGEVTVSLVKGSKGLRNTVKEPTNPGIFKPELQPNEAGQGFTLIFDITTKGYTDRITIDNITVYPNEKTALANEKEESAGNTITYLKEQAWKTEFANKPVVAQMFYDVIKTTGQIMPAQGDEQVVTAGASGIIKFGNNKVLSGSEIRNGETMFIISPSGLNENIEVKYKESAANYEKSKADYERAKELIKDKIISEREFSEVKLRFNNAESAFNTYSKNYSSGGQRVIANSSGFIRNVLVHEGQHVEQGEPLASISKNQKLVIKAEVSQQYFEKLKNISGANFKMPNGKTFNTDSLGGKLLSYGKSNESNSFFTPVYFEIENNGELIPGSFIEVYLKGNKTQNALTIPQTALIEEQGNFYVFVQVSGESFEKREVKISGNDGINVNVISGVREGERVVTKGAYQIKLATMSGALPAHGHEH